MLSLLIASVSLVLSPLDSPNDAVMTLAALASWEPVIAPMLKRQGMIADVPLRPRQFSEAEKMESFITPWTSNGHLPLPTLDELQDQGSHVVGRRGRLLYKITAVRRRRIPEIRIQSPEWSEFYGVPIFIEKMIVS